MDTNILYTLLIVLVILGLVNITLNIYILNKIKSTAEHFISDKIEIPKEMKQPILNVKTKSSGIKINLSNGYSIKMENVSPRAFEIGLFNKEGTRISWNISSAEYALPVFSNIAYRSNDTLSTSPIYLSYNLIDKEYYVLSVATQSTANTPLICLTYNTTKNNPEFTQSLYISSVESNVVGEIISI